MTRQNILMLGGTRFIGTALIVKLHSQIRDQAHLTCFHRGLHMENIPNWDGFVSHITGNRHNESDVAALFRNNWDTIIRSP